MKFLSNSSNNLSSSRQVWAHYHCWYGAPNGPNGAWRVWNHPLWATDKDYLTLATHDPDRIIGPEGRRDIGAANYPVLEPYDSRDPEILLQHIRWAREAGIDGFIFDWWGPGDITDLSMKTMLDILHAEAITDFRVTLLFDGPWARGDTVEQTVSRLQYIHDTYRGHSAFLRADGILVVFLYACGAYTLPQWREIRDRVETDGRRLILLGDRTDALDIFDGLQSYSTGIRGEEELRTFCQEQIAAASEKGTFVALPVLPGYDDRNVRFPGSVICRRNRAHYEMTWRVILDCQPDWVTICSWNEWAEGSNIEPDREHGNFYLEETARWVQRFK